jgi:hypothetical protein
VTCSGYGDTTVIVAIVRQVRYFSLLIVQVAQLFDEFRIAGARRQGEFVEGIIFLSEQMFGTVLPAWNRIQGRLRGLVAGDGLREGGCVGWLSLTPGKPCLPG